MMMGILRLGCAIIYLFITLLFPLCYQVTISITVFQEPVVELFRDRFFVIVEVVDVS